MEETLREKRWSILPFYGGPAGWTLFQGIFTIQVVMFTTHDCKYDHHYSLTVLLVTLTTFSTRMGSQSNQFRGSSKYTIGDTYFGQADYTLIVSLSLITKVKLRMENMIIIII